MADGTLHIDLDLHVTGGEVEGRAATDGQPERPFSGWVELLAALDAIIASGSREAAPAETGPSRVRRTGVALPSEGDQ
jgi:hypothetical protein